MMHLYSALILGDLHRLCIAFTHIHTPITAETMQSTNQQIGSKVQCLAQGHFDTNSGGAWVRTGNLVVTILPLPIHMSLRTRVKIAR